MSGFLIPSPRIFSTSRLTPSPNKTQFSSNNVTCEGNTDCLGDQQGTGQPAHLRRLICPLMITFATLDAFKSSKCSINIVMRASCHSFNILHKRLGLFSFAIPFSLYILEVSFYAFTSLPFSVCIYHFSPEALKSSIFHTFASGCL